MTRLNRRVARATVKPYSVLYAGQSNAKPIVVELVPGDVIEFRELRGRHRWRLDIRHAFMLAVRAAECRKQTVLPLEA